MMMNSPSQLVHLKFVTLSNEETQGAGREVGRSHTNNTQIPILQVIPPLSRKVWAGRPRTSHSQESPGCGRAQEVVSDAFICACVPSLHSLQPQAPIWQGLEPPAGLQGLARTQPFHRGHWPSSGLALQGHIIPGSHCYILGLHLEHRATCGKPQGSF